MFLSTCQPLCSLINESLASGHFPERWKSAFITPVFKDGYRRNVQNYRLISILGVVPKLFDKIISVELHDAIAGKLCVEQNGFVEGRAPITNLLLNSDFISESLCNALQVDSVYTDSQKAFDSVNHELLLRKLTGFCLNAFFLKLDCFLPH